MSSIQFTIPRRAADAVDFIALRRYGTEAKLPRNTIECSMISVPVGQARVTCSIDMAVFLIEALRRLALEANERGKSELAIACTYGVRRRSTPSTRNARGRQANRRRATSGRRRTRRPRKNRCRRMRLGATD
jgi:hypothetical protein